MPIAKIEVDDYADCEKAFEEIKSKIPKDIFKLVVLELCAQSLAQVKVIEQLKAIIEKQNAAAGWTLPDTSKKP